MINFRGCIDRRTYWVGLIAWIALDLIFSILLIRLVNVVHPDSHQPDNWVNLIGAIAFILGFVYALAGFISVGVKRARDIGRGGTSIAICAIFFSPLIILLGLIPGAKHPHEQHRAYTSLRHALQLTILGN